MKFSVLDFRFQTWESGSGGNFLRRIRIWGRKFWIFAARNQKTEFSKFGEALGKVRRQLDTASNSLEDLTITRTRAMERKLKSVETLPEVESEKLLDLQGEPNDD